MRRYASDAPAATSTRARLSFSSDANLNFYFLEVNTRLQVEHPRHRTGDRPRPGETPDSHCRRPPPALCVGNHPPRAATPWKCVSTAEDPDNNFFPSPGKIISRHAPTGPGIRLDEGVYEGWTVPMDYDPLLGKLIAWGNSREETIASPPPRARRIHHHGYSHQRQLVPPHSHGSGIPSRRNSHQVVG